MFSNLQTQAAGILPRSYTELGDIVAIDGSLTDAVLSMTWADYRKGSEKARVHMGPDINRSIPGKLFTTDGKAGERPFVSQILSPGETGVTDRGYQCHKCSDQWQEEDVFFACRIKAGTKKTIIKTYEADPESFVFSDAAVLPGTPKVNQTQKELRLTGYEIAGVRYRIANNRHDLTAEQIASVYKLRRDAEKFFAWRKRHLRVYHLIARSEHGLMIQILAGLITYLLLAIYCQRQHNEPVSIKRVRKLRIQIQNELRKSSAKYDNKQFFKEQSKVYRSYAKT